MMLGQEYFTGCGFDYVYERLDHNNILYTHKPENIDIMPEDYLNIHGHMHKWREYNTSDGKRNVNVYPYFFDNKPVTLDYILKHKEELMKDNKRSDWTQIGESAEYRDIEDLDIIPGLSFVKGFGVPHYNQLSDDEKRRINLKLVEKGLHGWTIDDCVALVFKNEEMSVLSCREDRKSISVP